MPPSLPPLMGISTRPHNSLRLGGTGNSPFRGRMTVSCRRNLGRRRELTGRNRVGRRRRTPSTALVRSRWQCSAERFSLWPRGSSSRHCSAEVEQSSGCKARQPRRGVRRIAWGVSPRVTMCSLRISPGGATDFGCSVSCSQSPPSVCRRFAACRFFCREPGADAPG